MNTKLKFGLGMAIAAIIGACSADSISNADGENWPSDFSVAEYARVNPDLANHQRVTSVAKKNAAYLQAAADSGKTVATSFKDSSELALFFSSDAVVPGNEAAVKELFTVYAGLSESYWPISGVAAFVNGVLGDSNDVIIGGIAAAEYRDALAPFHCLGQTALQDLEFIKSVQIDSTLIKQQYVLAGRYEGRPYRECREGEAVYKKVIKTIKIDTIVGGNKKYEWEYYTKLDSASESNWIYKTADSVEYNQKSLEDHKSKGDSIVYPAIIQTCAEILGVPETAPAEDSSAAQDSSDVPAPEAAPASEADGDSSAEPVAPSGVVIELVSVNKNCKSKPDSLKVDSTVTDKYVKSIVLTPLSANVSVPAGGDNRVWDFSADLYCKNLADGDVYLIP